MSDVNCPYCGCGQEINHDDGYGFEEDENHHQECVSCHEQFVFQTSIIYSYDVFCKNHGDHKFEHWGGDCWGCENCDYRELRKKEQPK